MGYTAATPLLSGFVDRMKLSRSFFAVCLVREHLLIAKVVKHRDIRLQAHDVRMRLPPVA
jgi:hypothetical protein